MRSRLFSSPFIISLFFLIFVAMIYRKSAYRQILYKLSKEWFITSIFVLKKPEESRYLYSIPVYSEKAENN